MQESEITQGVTVIRKSNPGVLGVLTGRAQRLGPRVMAQVNWGTNREYEDIRQLQAVATDREQDMDAVVSRGEFGTLADLRRRITYEKLKGTLTDVFYSMSTSVVRFYPHQFKPVLHFIDSPTNRLLIADEVGLGKTIEAALIWTEWQARQGARRLLVVCPPSLCPKWERELFERFQLPAEVVDAKMLLHLLERYRAIGNRLQFVAISSYDALFPRRTGEVVDGKAIDEKELLDSLVDPPRYGRVRVPDEGQLSRRAQLLYRLIADDDSDGFLDMAVFDEAHRMKNTATTYHTLGTVISRVSGATVCLSATPIHTQSRDLYALLSLVDPDYFREERMFDSLVERNRPVIQLLNTVSKPGADRATLVDLAAEIGASPYFAGSRVAARVCAQAEVFDGTPQAAVELFREADKLNLLGNYLSRTRKIQVADRRVQRKPVTLKVELAPMERAFYSAVLRQVRALASGRGPGGVSFTVIAPALRMASCIPSMKDCLDRGKWGGWDEELGELYVDLAEGFDLGDAGVPVINVPEFRDYDFELHDSKYAVLRNDLLRRIPHEKVLVFAFFKDTVRYLQRRLTADGIPALSVTGDITDRVLRDALMQQFQTDEFRVLLLSEVGAEGVDLQFCRTMVNYDLPWNPMRVEQRIGRIDRIGQLADSVTIVNFHMPGTIDGRIFELLYERIGIFQNTIGDLEGILGDQISRLTSDLLRAELTPDQETARIAAAARAIEERRKTEADLEQSSSALVAFTDYLAESIGESQRMGRFIRPDELRVYVEDYLADSCPGAHLDWDTPVPGCGRIQLPFEAWSRFEEFAKRRADALPSGFVSGLPVAVTFDPDVHEANRRRHKALVLVNHLNPFIKWITEENGQNQRRLHGVCAVAVASGAVPPGTYFFLVRRLSLTGLRKRERLYYGLTDLGTGRHCLGAQAEALLNNCQVVGRSLFPEQVPVCGPLLDALRAQLNDLCDRAYVDFTDEMQSKVLAQREQVEAHFGRKIATARTRLEGMMGAAGTREQGIQLTQRQIDALEKRREEALKRLEKGAEAIATMDDVCCGLVRVERG